MDSQGLGLDPQFANNSCDSQQNLRIYADLFFFPRVREGSPAYPGKLFFLHSPDTCETWKN
jgi:hypothetical protein